MMWPPTLPKRPCGRPHMCMKIAFRTLIGGASSMTNSLIFSVDLRHENECQEMAFSRQPCDVRFGSKADISQCNRHVNQLVDSNELGGLPPNLISSKKPARIRPKLGGCASRTSLKSLSLLSFPKIISGRTDDVVQP